MKVKCKRDLYWKQVPGYDGFLSESNERDPELSGEAVVHVFKKDREYEVVTFPDRESNGLEYVTIFAIGENGRWQRILEDSLHCNTTLKATSYFDFHTPLEAYKNPRIETSEELASEACCCDCYQVGQADDILENHACPMHIGRG